MRWMVLLSTLTIFGGCGLSVVGEGNPSSGGLGANNANDDASKNDKDNASGSSDAESGDADRADDSTTDAATLDDRGDASDAGGGGVVVLGSFGQTCPVGTIYEDDFSTDPSGRWFVVAGQWAWSAAAKTYTMTSLSATNHALIWIGARPTWKNYVVDVTLTMDGPVTGTDCNAGPVFRVGAVGNIPAPNNAGQMYLGAGKIPITGGVIFGIENDGWNQLANSSLATVTKNQSSVVRVDVHDQTIKVSANNTLGITITNSMFATGSVGIKSYNANLVVSRVKVTCK